MFRITTSLVPFASIRNHYCPNEGIDVQFHPNAHPFLVVTPFERRGASHRHGLKKGSA